MPKTTSVTGPLRDQLSLSVHQLAKILGVTRQTVYAWDNRTSEPPRSATIVMELLATDRPAGIREYLLKRVDDADNGLDTP